MVLIRSPVVVFAVKVSATLVMAGAFEHDHVFDEDEIHCNPLACVWQKALNLRRIALSGEVALLSGIFFLSLVDFWPTQFGSPQHSPENAESRGSNRSYSRRLPVAFSLSS